jgi:ribosomal protein L37AE/L43A
MRKLRDKIEGPLEKIGNDCPFLVIKADGSVFCPDQGREEEEEESKMPHAFCTRCEMNRAIRQNEKGFWFCRRCGQPTNGPEEEVPPKSSLKKKIRKVLDDPSWKTPRGEEESIPQKSATQNSNEEKKEPNL